MQLFHFTASKKEENVSFRQLPNVHCQSDLHRVSQAVWQLQWGRAHWRCTHWDSTWTQRHSSSHQDCSRPGVTQRVGINPVSPDAANPPWNAELVILTCNGKELVPAIRNRHQYCKVCCVTQNWLLNLPRCKPDKDTPLPTVQGCPLTSISHWHIFAQNLL